MNSPKIFPASGEVEAHSALRDALLAVVLPGAGDELPDAVAVAVLHYARAGERLAAVRSANSLDGSLAAGVEALLAVEAAGASLSAVMARLTALRSATTSAAQNVRAGIADTMASIGHPQVVTAHHTAAPFETLGVVEIDAPHLLPAEFWRSPDPVPDKPALLLALRAGRQVPGAHLAPARTSLRISLRKG